MNLPFTLGAPIILEPVIGSETEYPCASPSLGRIPGCTRRKLARFSEFRSGRKGKRNSEAVGQPGRSSRTGHCRPATLRPILDSGIRNGAPSHHRGRPRTLTRWIAWPTLRRSRQAGASLRTPYKGEVEGQSYHWVPGARMQSFVNANSTGNTPGQSRSPGRFQWSQPTG